MGIEIKSPNVYDLNLPWKKIFLAGSIEMGVADDWQRVITDRLSNKDCVFFNPRRKHWDSTWEQSINNPQFKEQVEWELKHLEDSDVIVMYFDPNTKSPVSLLELGLFASSGKLIVYCPNGFWRKGNVDIVCKKYNITTVDSLEELIEKL
jgi:hypothetical protein